jgi:hypothetical protein
MTYDTYLGRPYTRIVLSELPAATMGIAEACVWYRWYRWYGIMAYKRHISVYGIEYV